MLFVSIIFTFLLILLQAFLCNLTTLHLFYKTHVRAGTNFYFSMLGC